MKRINALTIAGNDPSGGAGIQADLKTFSALGAYGCSVISALIAQNTCGVQYTFRIDPNFVTAQLESVFQDIRIDSSKIGLIAETDIVEIVAEQLQRYQIKNTVLDTVMVVKSGETLFSSDSVTAMRTKLLPQVAIITPNLQEAAILLESPVARNELEMQNQGKALLALGCNAVLIKGGHLNGVESPDWLFTQKSTERFTTRRIKTKNTHGAGCTLSAAMAALRPRCDSWTETVRKAKSWLNTALIKSDTLEVGSGNGPLHHFHEWW